MINFLDSELKVLNSLFPTAQISNHRHNQIFNGVANFTQINQMVKIFDGFVENINRSVNSGYVKSLSENLDTTCIEFTFGIYSVEDDEDEEQEKSFLCILDGQHRYQVLRNTLETRPKSKFLKIPFPFKIIRLQDLNAAIQKISTYNTRRDFNLDTHYRKDRLFCALKSRNDLPWRGGWSYVGSRLPKIKESHILKFIEFHDDYDLEMLVSQLTLANEWMRKNAKRSSISDTSLDKIKNRNTWLALSDEWIEKKFTE